MIPWIPKKEDHDGRDRQGAHNWVAQDQGTSHDADDAHEQFPAPAGVVNEHSHEGEDTSEDPVESQHQYQREGRS